MNNGRKTPMPQLTYKSDLLSSFKPQLDSDNEFFYPGDTQEFSLINRCTKQDQPRKFPMESIDSLFKHRSYLNSSRDSLKKNKKILCQACLEYEQIIEELQREQQKASEKFFTTEKHLKQYDSLLQIKDSRLQQQELSLKNDLEAFEKEKERLGKDLRKMEKVKAEVCGLREEVEEKGMEIEKRIREIGKVEMEVRRLEREVESKNKAILRGEEERGVIEKKYQELVAVNRELTIRQVMKESVVVIENSIDTDQKLEKLQVKKQNLKNYEKHLNTISLSQKETQQEINRKLELLQETENRIKSEQKLLDDTKERINEEIESIDELKEILKVQEDNLARERKLLQEKYEEKLSFVEDLKKKVSNRLKKLDEEKELFCVDESRIEQLNDTVEGLKKVVWDLESNLKDVEGERKVLQDRIVELEIEVESLKSSEKGLKGKNTELEQVVFSLNNAGLLSKIEELVKKNKLLETENESLDMKVQEYQSLNNRLMKDLEILKSEKQRSDPSTSSETEEKSHERLKKISIELEIKLSEVKAKEKEIISLQEYLSEEKKKINAAADYIKSINDDLAIKQSLLDEEKEEFERQKSRIAEVELKQQEKHRVLVNKELELVELLKKTSQGVNV